VLKYYLGRSIIVKCMLKCSRQADAPAARKLEDWAWKQSA
jgi:hypothetical protein